MASSNSLYLRPFHPSRFLPFTKQSLCLFTLCSFFATTLTGNSFAQDNALDLSDLSLEELMNLEVVTANRQAQPLSETTAAIFVISSKDIKDSGVTTIADALRMAPGVQVAKSGSHTWAVSIRGFNDRFSNKLLVLMDGRTLYNPLHSGVTWEVQDMILEDIDRIEVIRGPGAAMWGANAVNGVINIITKDSSKTLGTLLTAASGNVERFHGQARFGGTIGENSTYRVYGKYLTRDEGENKTGLTGEDSWDSRQSGFRLDRALSKKSKLTVQGDLYKAQLDDLNLIVVWPFPVGVPTQNVWDMGGYHVLGQWQYSIAGNNNLQAKLYYDSTTMDSLFGDEDRNTLDFDFQHIFPLGDIQSITWGVSYRYSSDDIEGSLQVDTLNESSRDDNLYSAFFQDEISLFHQNLKFIIGSKFEHNNYTGFEIQPSIRSNWRPAENHSLWLAISRAVRTPSRYEHDGIIRSPLLPDPETGVMIAGIWESNEAFDSENLIAYEAGYRHIASEKISYDLALFYNDYDSLKVSEPVSLTIVSSPLGEIPVQTYTSENKSSGYTWGGELVVNYVPMEWWRIQGVYSYLQMNLENDSDSGARNDDDIENTSPSSQFSLRSFMAFPNNFSLNLWLRYVGTLASENTDAYWEGDIRVAWTPLEHVELSLVGQNLFHDSHKEIEQASYLSLNTEVKRSVYLKLSWNY
jgi:iron complex outermembrane recepter protein